MEAEWMAALPRLRQQVGERNFATWIEPIRCAKDDSGLRLEVSSRFFQEWVTRHFLPTIRRTLADGRGADPSVRVVVAAETGRAVPLAEVPAAPRRAAVGRSPKIGRLVADYTFETFVVGPANQVGYHAARSVAEAPGRRFNPFFLWGGVGLGKTHLLNALAHDLLGRSPRGRLACLSAETFMNTLITSLREDKMAAFRDRFRELDVLILDDVQFLAGKERTQEEFFHTFNALYSAGRQVVLTSDKPPHAIKELEQRLRSRFEGGMIADIHPPTLEMRIEIATRKAAAQGVELPDGIARLIAHRSGPSVRELEGALTRVLATTALQGLPLDIPMVEHLLGPIVPLAAIVSIETVQEVVSQHFRISVSDLQSHRRVQPLTLPRQVAMYLSRMVANQSFPSIAEKFGGRDHSTVMYAVRAIEQKQTDDPSTRSLVGTLSLEVRRRASL